MLTVRGTLPLAGTRSRRAGRGFSFIETLAVVAVLAILAAIVGVEVNRTFKRQKLRGTASEIQQLAQRALTEMQRRNVAIFVQIGAPTAGTPSGLPITLVADTGTTAGALDGSDLVIQTLTLDLLDAGANDVQQIALSTTNKTQVASTLWSDNSTNRNNARALMCDLLGRAIDPASGNQITGVATLAITHTDMIAGTLTPKINYELRINPLWNVTLNKVVAP